MDGSFRLVILDRSDKSSLMHWMSAFFHRRIFLLGGFGRVAVIVVSNKTISRSLLPIEGLDLHRCVKLEWVVRMMSNVFCFLVGKLTICSKLLSDTMSRNDWLTLDGYWFVMMFPSWKCFLDTIRTPPWRLFGRSRRKISAVPTIGYTRSNTRHD